MNRIGSCILYNKFKVRSIEFCKEDLVNNSFWGNKFNNFYKIVYNYNKNVQCECQSWALATIVATPWHSFLGQTIVACCLDTLYMYVHCTVYAVTTPFLFVHVPKILTRCRVVGVAMLNICYVPSSDECHHY